MRDLYDGAGTMVQESSNGPILRDKTGGELPVEARRSRNCFRAGVFPSRIKDNWNV